MTRRIPPLRALAIVMPALAMVLKLAFAPGLMPSLDDQGARLVICTGQGAKVIADPAGHGGEQHKPCPFEGQGAAAPTNTPQPLLLAGVEYPAPTAVGLTSVSPGSGLSAPPPPSTGPPSQSA